MSIQSNIHYQRRTSCSRECKGGGGGGGGVTKLDLKTAYLQMVLTENSSKYLVINTIDRLTEYKRMPYGITSGPAIFQNKLSTELKFRWA